MTVIPPVSDSPSARERARRIVVPAARIAGLAFMLMVVLMVGMRVARAGALPGAHLGAQDVSGLNGAQLHDVVRTLAAARAEHTITVVREAVPDAGATEESRLTATGAELGFALDVDATVQRVLRRGRQLNPFAAFADQVRAFFGVTTVQPVQQLDNEVFTAWLRDATPSRVPSHLKAPPWHEWSRRLARK